MIAGTERAVLSPTEVPVVPVVQLNVGQRHLAYEHLAALPAADIRRRFGSLLHPAGLEAYVDAIDFEGDVVFAVLADDLSLAGMAHLGCRDGAAEVGLSVLPDWRGQGIGSALFQRALVRARNLQAVELFVHCQADNQPMLQIARRAGMRLVLEMGEADAVLDLPPASPESLGSDLASLQSGWFDYALKAQLDLARCFSDGLTDNLRPWFGPYAPARTALRRNRRVHSTTSSTYV